MLRDLSFGTPGPITIQAGRQISQDRWLDQLRDVYLTWSNFFITNDCCTSIYDDARTAVSGIVDWPGLSKIAGIDRDGDDFIVSRSRLQDAERIGGRILHASSNEPHNWGMFLLYVLPAVNYFIENRQAYDRLLVYADYENMQEMLWLAGLKPDDIIRHDCSRAYHFDSIDVFRQPQRDFYIAQDTKAMFAKLRKKVAGGSIEQSPRRIYIGRRRRTTEMGSYRGLMNERELVDRLTMMGYCEVDPEYLPPQRQIALFGSARQIVALGGAGLFNVVFCKPSTKIVIIESSRDHLDNHSAILSSMDVDYGVIIGEPDQSDPVSYNNRWTVDVDRATAAIARFMD